MSDIDPVSIRFEPGIPAPEGVIPLCVPEIRGNEWKYIKECLDTNWVSSVGPFVDRFERMVVDYVGAKYAVATVNGTAALHIALLVSGVKHDDEVIVPTLTFIAPVNVVRYVGAWPVFVDADPVYWQMDPERVVDFIAKKCQWRKGKLLNKVSGRHIKAIVPVHILGHPCDMDPIVEVAQKYGLVVIEDSTESLGAKYKGRLVGQLGAIACFSFNGNKVITTGGGGMIVTDNAEWACRARYLTTQAKGDPIEYVHNEIGYNYRLTNVQGALGCAQMEKLDEYINAKRSIARAYAQVLASVIGITCMREAPWASSTFWIYTVLVDEKRYGMSSRTLLRHLAAMGIQTRPLWQPLHLSLAHRGAYSSGRAVAEELVQKGLSLPSSVGLTSSDQDRVVQNITTVARSARLRGGSSRAR